MVKRTLTIFAVIVILILGLSLVFLDSGGSDVQVAAVEDGGQTEPGDSDDLTGDRAHPNDNYSIRDDFLSYFNKTNPATGENYSEKEVSALQYLFDKFPLNDFVNSLINPESQVDKKKHIYALAEKIQTGQATEDEIREYYALGEKDLLDKLEVLPELGDKAQAERQRAELQESLRAMYQTRDDQLRQARERAGSDTLNSSDPQAD